MKRHMSSLDYSEFARGVVELHGDRCWACRTNPDERWKCIERSQDRLDAHHVISQQTIKREVDPELVLQALVDPRNGVPLARWHHDQVEHCMTRIELPDDVWRFAEDYGLTWALERRRDAA